MNLKDFYVLLIRLLLGYIFFSAGLCKLADGHFGQLIGPPFLIRDLESYGLGGFGWYLAFSQVMTGALILSQRWSVLGLVMLVPMNVSILATTLSMHWAGTPFVNVLLLIINILALFYEWGILRFFLLPETPELRTPTRTHQLFPSFWWAVSVLVAALIAVFSIGFAPWIMMFAGGTTLLLAWLNVWQSGNFPILIRITLLASLLAVMSLSLTEPLSAFNLPVHIPLIGGVLLTIIATVAHTFLETVFKRQSG